MPFVTADGAHVLLYPYPAPGHVIPMLDLAAKLLLRGLTVTVVVTPLISSLLEPLLSMFPSTLRRLLINPPEEPSENDPITKMLALKELDYEIVTFFETHNSPPVAILADIFCGEYVDLFPNIFLGWTHHLAETLGVPRVTFSPSGAYGFSVGNFIWSNEPSPDDPEDEDSSVVKFHSLPGLPSFLWWQISFIFRAYKKDDPQRVFFKDSWLCNNKSWGMVVNTAEKFEADFIDHLKKETGHAGRVWAVGPLLPPPEEEADRGGLSAVQSREVLSWLDRHLENSVVYVCFGSITTLTREQTEVLVRALEMSGVRFILSLREAELPEGYKERVEERGFIIRGWAPQVSILRHAAVGAFLTHCGWNSVLEGLSAGVVMLTWPMGADQFTNASLLVDQLGVGVRIGGGEKWVLEPEKLAEKLVESVEKDRPERVRALELSRAAMGAVKGGSSEKDLEEMVCMLNELPRPKVEDKAVLEIS